MNNNRGYFAIGVYHPKKQVNVGGVWRTAFNFGANHIFTIGRRYKPQSSDTTKAHHNIPLFNYQTFDDFLKNLPTNCEIVGIELDERAKPIRNFIHPTRCIYLLGCETYGLPPEVLNKCRHVIQIPGKHCLNVAVAGSIVMFDRINKS